LNAVSLIITTSEVGTWTFPIACEESITQTATACFNATKKKWFPSLHCCYKQQETWVIDGIEIHKQASLVTPNLFLYQKNLKSVAQLLKKMNSFFLNNNLFVGSKTAETV